MQWLIDGLISTTYNQSPTNGLRSRPWSDMSNREIEQAKDRRVLFTYFVRGGLDQKLGRQASDHRPDQMKR